MVREVITSCLLLFTEFYDRKTFHVKSKQQQTEMNFIISLILTW